jgi:D-beta-D-heptose 7-phosphate kinase/D-beta-D-heptose 1-phosphate adenosyltransferase
MTDYSTILKNTLIPRILVIGDAILDSYVEGVIERINPEAPVPLLNVTSSSISIGGAGNVVSNLHALGAHVYFTGVIGNDLAGDSVYGFITAKTKTAFFNRDPKKKTPVKTRLISQNHFLFRFDDETTTESAITIEKHSLDMIDLVAPHIVIFSDYGKGSLCKESVQAIIKVCNANNILTYVDPHVNNIGYYENCQCLKLNLNQAKKIAQRLLPEVTDYTTESFFSKFRDAIHEKYKIDDVIITLADKGLYANIGGAEFRKQSKKVVNERVIDVTGAGDTIISTFTFCLSKGADIEQSLELSSIAANIAIQNMGTYHVKIDELISAANSY